MRGFGGSACRNNRDAAAPAKDNPSRKHASASAERERERGRKEGRKEKWGEAAGGEEEDEADFMRHLFPLKNGREQRARWSVGRTAAVLSWL